MNIFISGLNGRLLVTGDSDSNTVLISDNFKDTLRGENVNRLTIANIHFTRDKVRAKTRQHKQTSIQVLTSQARVCSLGPGWIKLQIEVRKFPGIENIFNNKSRSGIFK